LQSADIVNGAIGNGTGRSAIAITVHTTTPNREQGRRGYRIQRNTSAGTVQINPISSAVDENGTVGPEPEAFWQARAETVHDAGGLCGQFEGQETTRAGLGSGNFSSTSATSSAGVLLESCDVDQKNPGDTVSHKSTGSILHRITDCSSYIAASVAGLLGSGRFL